MQFVAPAEHYDRFMGRYAPTLAVALSDAAGVAAGMRVLDVGCGPGGLTHELVARTGAERVAAIDPAPQFAEACRERHPGAGGEHRRPGTARGDIAAHLERAGLQEVRDGELTARAEYAGFDDFWEPFTLAVGPAGEFLRSLDPEQQAAVRDGCRRALPSDGAFALGARAWFARGTVPG